MTEDAPPFAVKVKTEKRLKVRSFTNYEPPGATPGLERDAQVAREELTQKHFFQPWAQIVLKLVAFNVT